MKKFYFFSFLLSLCITFALPVQGNAVAGGYGGGSTSGGGSVSIGGGSSYTGSNFGSRNTWRSYGYNEHYGSSGLTDYLLLGASVGGVTIFSLYKRRKGQKEKSDDLLAQIPGKKNEKKKVLKDVQDIFFAIQLAWEKESLEDVKNYYTQKLFMEHQQVLQQNKVAGVKNHTKKVVLQQVGNYRQIREDSFSIRIDFSCYDYVEDVTSNRILSGNKHKKQYFSQLWYFNYSAKYGWQVDFIQPINLG
jgi:hypothetical protein